MSNENPSRLMPGCTITLRDGREIKVLPPRLPDVRRAGKLVQHVVATAGLGDLKEINSAADLPKLLASVLSAADDATFDELIALTLGRCEPVPDADSLTAGDTGNLIAAFAAELMADLEADGPFGDALRRGKDALVAAIKGVTAAPMIPSADGTTPAAASPPPSGGADGTPPT